MKPPLKPFIVEVKRSRSKASGAKPVVSEPLGLIDAKPTPGPLSLSQARREAEKMFTPLSSAPSAELPMPETAESVFSAAVPRIVAVEGPARDSVMHMHDRVEQAASNNGTVPARTRKPRVAKVRAPTTTVNKTPKAIAQDVFAAVGRMSAGLTGMRQDPHTDVPEGSAQPAEMEQGAPLLLAAEAEPQSGEIRLGLQASAGRSGYDIRARRLDAGNDVRASYRNRRSGCTQYKTSAGSHSFLRTRQYSSAKVTIG